MNARAIRRRAWLSADTMRSRTIYPNFLTAVGVMREGPRSSCSEDCLWIDDPRSLLQCVQKGTGEFHSWASRSRDVEMPDRKIFDAATSSRRGGSLVALTGSTRASIQGPRHSPSVVIGRLVRA